MEGRGGRGLVDSNDDVLPTISSFINNLKVNFGAAQYPQEQLQVVFGPLYNVGLYILYSTFQAVGGHMNTLYKVEAVVGRALKLLVLRYSTRPLTNSNCISALEAET